MTSSQGAIDSHHHFWDLTRLDYPWMPPGPSVVRQNYLPPDLRPEIAAVGISRTVVVQAHQSLDEAKFLLDIAKRTEFVAGVTKIASIPGVYCKVSGMVTEADNHNWKVEDLGPYVAHVREQFGMGRLMFGSDWPVCLLASSYSLVFEAALEAMGPMTQDERSSFLGGNARRFYRL